MHVTNLRVEEVAVIETVWIQDGGDLTEIVVDGKYGAAVYDSTARSRNEYAAQVASVVEPRTVHIVLRPFHSAAV